MSWSFPRISLGQFMQRLLVPGSWQLWGCQVVTYSQPSDRHRQCSIIYCCMSVMSFRRLEAIALLRHEEEQSCKIRKKIWIHVIKKRKSGGEYWTLWIKDADDKVNLLIFKMLKTKFSYLWQRIKIDLAKINPNNWEAISPISLPSMMPDKELSVSSILKRQKM